MSVKSNGSFVNTVFTQKCPFSPFFKRNLSQSIFFFKKQFESRDNNKVFFIDLSSKNFIHRRNKSHFISLVLTEIKVANLVKGQKIAMK